jgi:hypothetical protein
VCGGCVRGGGPHGESGFVHTLFVGVVLFGSKVVTSWNGTILDTVPSSSLVTQMLVTPVAVAVTLFIVGDDEKLYMPRLDGPKGS